MKIIELYQHVQAIALSESSFEFPENDTTSLQRLYLEYANKKLVHTLLTLSAVTPQTEISADDIAVIKGLFDEFYSVVKQTPLIPTHLANCYTTYLYLMTASLLEQITKISRYQFMFPTLTINEYEVSTMSLTDPDLSLTDFILSDDETCVIELLSCLDFAENDGKLKFTCLFDGQPKFLSQAETKRVIRHSVETKNYWDAIHDVIDIELNGESIGAVLKRLAHYLSSGGAHGGRDGAEFNSGKDANVAIDDFFEWFNELEEDERNLINKLTASDLTVTMGDLLGRLSRPTDVDYEDSIYCVELISGNILHILTQHPELFNLLPKKTDENYKNQRIELAINRRKLAREELQHSLKSFVQKTKTSFPDWDTLFLNRFINLADLPQFLGEKMRAYFQATGNMLRTMRKLEPKNRLTFVRNLNNISIDFTSGGVDCITSLLQQLPSKNRMEGVKLLIGKLAKLSCSQKEYHSFITTLTPNNSTTITNLMAEYDIHFFCQDLNLLSYALNRVDQASFANLINLLTNQLTLLFKGDFHKVLPIALLPPRDDFLINALEIKLIQLFNDTTAFYNLLISLPKEQWLHVFKTLQQARHHHNDERLNDQQLLQVFQLVEEDKKQHFLDSAKPFIEDAQLFLKSGVSARVSLFEKVIANRNGLFTRRPSSDRLNCSRTDNSARRVTRHT